MIIKKPKRKCRFCERPIEKGHRCYKPKEIDRTEVYGRGRVAGIKVPKEQKIRGEAELFTSLQMARGNRSEISGKLLLPIGHPQWHWQFLHVLPKGTYKRYKLNPRNIVLALPEEHAYQDKAIRDPNWHWFFLLKDFLKTEYNESKNIR